MCSSPGHWHKLLMDLWSHESSEKNKTHKVKHRASCPLSGVWGSFILQYLLWTVTVLKTVVAVQFNSLYQNINIKWQDFITSRTLRAIRNEGQLHCINTVWCTVTDQTHRTKGRRKDRKYYWKPNFSQSVIFLKRKRNHKHKNTSDKRLVRVKSGLNERGGVDGGWPSALQRGGGEEMALRQTKRETGSSWTDKQEQQQWEWDGGLRRKQSNIRPTCQS